MNNTILLVEDNLDDQFLIKRALNKTQLIGVWSKLTEKTADCNSLNLRAVQLSYPYVPTVCNPNQLVVSVQLVENREEAALYLKGKKSYVNRERYPLPALILISVAMANLLGLSLLAWIKRQPELMHIPIVVISDIDKKDQAINLGASAYIFKTLCFTGLIDVVKTLLPSKPLISQKPRQRNLSRPKPLSTGAVLYK